MIIKYKTFNEKYFRKNKAHFNKLKQRNCENSFEIWRATKRELDEEYKDFLDVITKIGKNKLDKKEQKETLKGLRRSIKGFSMGVYSYKEKIKNFLNCYLGKNEYRDEPAKELYNLVIEKQFWTIYINFFIKLHNSIKHSGVFKILAFDIKEKGKDFYIINFSIKEEERWIGTSLDGADIVHYFKKAMSYLNDIDTEIFHYMVRRS